MQYKYTIHTQHQLVIEEVAGSVTVEELAAKTETIFADSLYQPHFRGIADYRNAQSAMTKVELYSFTSLLNDTEKFGQGKWAIIAHDPIVVALAHVFQIRFKNENLIGIFNTARAATRFIDCPAALEYLKDEAVI